MTSDQPHEHPSGESPRIIRRHPTGPIPEPDDTRTGYVAQPAREDEPTGLIRPTPTEDAPTGLIRPAAEAEDDASAVPTANTAVATVAVSIVSGWATAVIATDLITGWWSSDRLFCVALGFLTLVFSASTVTGVILLLRRRRIGCYLVAVGAVVALLIFAGLFIAGAKVAWPVYAMPVLPVASIVLALLPNTRRWSSSGF